MSRASVLFYSASDHAKQAVAMERSNQYQLAVQFYNQAALKAQTALDTGLEGDNVRTAQLLISRSVNRAQELSCSTNSPPNPQPKSYSGSYASTPVRPLPPQPIPAVPMRVNNQYSPSITGSPPIQNSIISERPNVHFADVAGLDAAKAALNEAVLLPIKLPKMFSGPTRPWKGILLYGPPGTGKSYLAKAVAGECLDATFITVSTADLTSKWVGESEKLIKRLFETARAHKPSVVFIDEIDSIVSERNDHDTETDKRIKTEFLIQMDGFGSNDGTVIIAATNLPWVLDPAMRRRFEKRIYVPLPDFKARSVLIKNHLRGALSLLTDSEIDAIARATDGYSGADLNILIRDALMQPIREIQNATSWVKVHGTDQDGRERDNLWMPASGWRIPYLNDTRCTWDQLPKDDIARPPLEMRHMQASLKKVKPSVASVDLRKYVEWTNSFGEDGT